jgi:hypothetical protein
MNFMEEKYLSMCTGCKKIFYKGKFVSGTEDSDLYTALYIAYSFKDCLCGGCLMKGVEKLVQKDGNL